MILLIEGRSDIETTPPSWVWTVILAGAPKFLGSANSGTRGDMSTGPSCAQNQTRAPHK